MKKILRTAAAIICLNTGMLISMSPAIATPADPPPLGGTPGPSAMRERGSASDLSPQLQPPSPSSRGCDWDAPQYGDPVDDPKVVWMESPLTKRFELSYQMCENLFVSPSGAPDERQFFEDVKKWINELEGKSRDWFVDALKNAGPIIEKLAQLEKFDEKQGYFPYKIDQSGVIKGKKGLIFLQYGKTSYTKTAGNSSTCDEKERLTTRGIGLGAAISFNDKMGLILSTKRGIEPPKTVLFHEEIHAINLITGNCDPEKISLVHFDLTGQPYTPSDKIRREEGNVTSDSERREVNDAPPVGDYRSIVYRKNLTHWEKIKKTFDPNKFLSEELKKKARVVVERVEARRKAGEANVTTTTYADDQKIILENRRIRYFDQYADPWNRVCYKLDSGLNFTGREKIDFSFKMEKCTIL